MGELKQPEEGATATPITKHSTEDYGRVLSELLRVAAEPDSNGQKLVKVLEQNLIYLDGRFFAILGGFAEEAAINGNESLAEVVKQVTSVARSYRASLLLQKLPQGATAAVYEQIAVKLIDAKGNTELENILQQHQSQVNEELAAVLMFAAIRVRQAKRDDLVETLVQLADLVLIFKDKI